MPFFLPSVKMPLKNSVQFFFKEYKSPESWAIYFLTNHYVQMSTIYKSDRGLLFTNRIQSTKLREETNRLIANRT